MNLFWVEQKRSDLPPTENWLSPGELHRFETMRFPKRRSDWLLGRWTAKCALAARLGVSGEAESLARLEIRAAASGQPEAYVDGVPLPLAVSISHRAGVALCAVAPGGAEMGCDLELVEERSEAFAADYFTAEEQALISRNPRSQRNLLLNLLWSTKESALKTLHEGLRLDTRSIHIDVDLSADDSDETWKLVSVHLSDGSEFCGRWRQSGGLLRTIVARAPSLEISPIRLASASLKCHAEFSQCESSQV